MIDAGIGKPQRYPHEKPNGSFGNFSDRNCIQANVYGGDQTRLATRDLREIGLQSYFLESGYIDGGPQIRYAFEFSAKENAEIFAQKFREKFGFQGDDDWLVKIEPVQPTLVLISYCSLASRASYYRSLWVAKIPHATLAQAAIADTPENKKLWLDRWQDANAQLGEHFDIPELVASTTLEAKFIMPGANDELAGEAIKSRFIVDCRSKPIEIEFDFSRQ